MGPINYVVYSLVIKSNLYLKEKSISFKTLDEMIQSLSQINPIFFKKYENSKLTKSWKEYLDEVNCVKVLLKPDGISNSIEVLKPDGYSDLWCFEGCKKENKYVYILKKNNKKIRHSEYKTNINYVAFLSQAKDYISKLDSIMVLEGNKKSSNYFEKILKLIESKEIGNTTIKTNDLNTDIQLLICIYERTGDFRNYRAWNPFNLGVDREKKLTILYGSYNLFRNNMFVEVVNSI